MGGGSIGSGVSRAGTRSVSASGTWRTAFDMGEGEIYNLDLEDDHRWPSRRSGSG